MTEGTWDWIWRAVVGVFTVFFGYMTWLSAGTPFVVVGVFGVGLFGVTAITYPRPDDPNQIISQ